MNVAVALQGLQKELRQLNAELSGSIASGFEDRAEAHVHKEPGEAIQLSDCRQIADARLSAKRRRVQKIEDTILRIDRAGQIGMCSDCGEEISEQRLQYDLTTTDCVTCATKKEEKKERGRPMKGSFGYRPISMTL